MTVLSENDCTPAPELDADEYELDPEAADLPELEESDFPQANPADPDEDDFAQDDMDDSDLEGLGGPDEPVWKRAAARVAAKIRAGASNAVGYCLKEIRTVNEVASKYMCAADSMNAADNKHWIGDWSKVPRGAIVYYDSPSSRYGHIVESLGGGYVGSTDWPTARWGRVHGGTLKSAWGYTVACWSPQVNDVTVWWPKSAKTGEDWSRGAVYIAKLKRGQNNSDSVRRLQHRLNHHQELDHQIPVTGNWGSKTTEQVRKWQRRVATGGPKDGTSLSADQARRLFGDNYSVRNQTP